MNFPDNAQFEKLSESLWEKMPIGRAAVMVGAGFSINSDPLPGNTRRFPSWAGLAKSMASKLGASESSNLGNFPKSFLRLASEYEAAFGRNDLNQLISVEIPDKQYVPSNLHLRLLELPWTDVFTTNYDTLLERTPVQKRAYHIVTKPVDLSRDRGPRIVKLHGSFPSQTPFIITEDDFRTYPTNFAPFVNTVRQSLLENAFLLLGFSGEDPNFLNWTGWVRDQIGDEHCPIYLCGVLSLDTGQKMLLESQGIRLIDLTPVVLNIDDPSLKHRIALEWFLEELHAAEPQSPETWPEISPSVDRVRSEYLPSQLFKNSQTPIEPKVKLPIDDDFVKSTILRWRAEREGYPGWLVAPGFIRERLWKKTVNKIELLFSKIEPWPIPEKLIVAWEIEWRISTALGFYCKPWLEKIEAITEKAIAFLQGGKDFVTTHIESYDLSPSRAKSMIFDLAISCARDARESFDFQNWQKWIDLLSEAPLKETRRQSQIDFESALSLLYQGKRTSARMVMNRYATSSSPYEQLKKASLFMELDDVAKAADAANQALTDIRDGLRARGDSTELLSLEGWALFQINNMPLEQSYEEKEPQRDEFRRRWRELRIQLCDPWPIKEEIEAQLDRDIPSDTSGTFFSHAFHPFRLMKTEIWKADTITQFLPAFSYIRLFEAAAIPLRTSYYTLTSAPLYSAIRWTNQLTPGWTPALMIRRGAHKAFKEQDFLSRFEVLNLSQDQVSSIYSFCSEAFQEIVGGNRSVATMPSGDSDSLEVCVEILSRLAFRLSEEQLKDSFENCIALHQHPDLPSHKTLHDVCDPWFERLIYCAPNVILKIWLIKILEFRPFHPSSESEVPESHRWIDPIRHYDLNRTAKIGLSRRSKGLIEATSRTLQMARIERGELRNRLVARLIRLYIWGILSKKEERELSKLIWEQGKVVSNLPRCAGFTLSSFLQFPCPDTRVARLQIKKSLFSELPTESVASVTDDNFVEVTVQMKRWFSRVKDMTAYPNGPKTKGVKLITWSNSEAEHFRLLVSTWWDKFAERYRKMRQGHVIPRAEFFQRNNLAGHIKPFRSFLRKVVIPKLNSTHEKEVTELKRIVRESEELFSIDFSTRVAMIPLSSNAEVTEGKSLIDDALLRTDSESAKDALMAVDEWIFRWRHVAGFPKVPRILIERIVNSVAFSQDICEVLAFDILCSELTKKDCLLKVGDISILTRSMEAWEISTRITTNSSRPPFEKGQILDLRTSMTELTVFLLPLATKKDVKRLLEVKRALGSDLLPEIQRLLEDSN